MRSTIKVVILKRVSKSTHSNPFKVIILIPEAKTLENVVWGTYSTDRYFKLTRRLVKTKKLTIKALEWHHLPGYAFFALNFQQILHIHLLFL